MFVYGEESETVAIEKIKCTDTTLCPRPMAWRWYLGDHHFFLCNYTLASSNCLTVFVQLT